MRRAKGQTTPEGRQQISISLEPEMFKQVLETAIKNERTFAAQVRVWIKEGLER